MDEDVIVVDDFEPQTPLTNGVHPQPVASTSTTTSGRPQRAAARRRSSPGYDPDFAPTERTTRSHAKGRIAPKLKLKLSDKAAANAPGMSFLGPYDRELDSDDEELSFEEQFILRMSEGEDCEKLKKMVASREVGQDVWFKFKGALCAAFVNISKPDAASSFIYCARLSKSRLSHREQHILLQASRPPMYNRVSEDTGQQTDVQSRRHMSGRHSLFLSPCSLFSHIH